MWVPDCIRRVPGPAPYVGLLLLILLWLFMLILLLLLSSFLLILLLLFLLLLLLLLLIIIINNSDTSNNTTTTTTNNNNTDHVYVVVYIVDIRMSLVPLILVSFVCRTDQTRQAPLAWEVGGIRLEASSRFVGSKRPITGLNLLVYAWKTEGYGLIELEISNSTISTVFHQPLIAQRGQSDVPQWDGAQPACDTRKLGGTTCLKLLD